MKADDTGGLLVQVSITNHSASAVTLGPRSIIQNENNARTTNFSDPPLFIDLAGIGSRASTIELEAGEGIIASLSPLQVSNPFKIEFVCFPKRAGIAGVIDEASDQIQEFKSGSGHESYLGTSYFATSPLIATGTFSDDSAKDGRMQN